MATAKEVSENLEKKRKEEARKLKVNLFPGDAHSKYLVKFESTPTLIIARYHNRPHVYYNRPSMRTILHICVTIVHSSVWFENILSPNVLF